MAMLVRGVRLTTITRIISVCRAAVVTEPTVQLP